jgi:polyhydroxybutyrate depolymerase
MTVIPQVLFYLIDLFKPQFLFLVVSIAGLAACSSSGTSYQGLDAGVLPAATGGGGGSSGYTVTGGSGGIATTTGGSGGTTTTPGGSGGTTTISTSDAGGSTAGSGPLDASTADGGGAIATGGSDGTQPTAGSGGTGGTGGGDVIKSSGCGATTWPTSNTYTIDVSGSSRSYILRIPDNYDTNHPYRLILAFHPLGGTAEMIANGFSPYYGLWNLAQGSTIFVAPQGTAFMGSALGWANRGGQDIEFTKAMITRFTSELCIDESRIFSEGFSMGGSMSYAIACAMPDTVRAVAVHSGGPMSGCVAHDKPVAYFMTHGTEDTVCTYPEYGVPQLNDFANVNGCTPQTLPTPSGTAPSCVDFANCSEGHPTRACIFVGPHTPSPPGNWVPTETWTFISQF